MSETETVQVSELLAKYENRRSSLIPVLQEVQSQYRYLPQPVLRQIAEKLDVPLPDVYHVATFYNCFSLEPVGRNLVQVCLGTACHVRGAPRVLDRILTDLKLPQPGTTKDVEFTVRPVRCIGCCGLAPVVRVNDNTHPHMTQAKVKGMLNKYHRKPEAAKAAGQAPGPPGRAAAARTGVEV
jgi:NADH-quinone oxidoreductase subunit E